MAATLDAARDLHIVRTNNDHTLEAARKIEAATWAMADALVEDYPEDIYPVNDTNSGLYEQLDLVSEQLRNEGLKWGRQVLRKYRTTAIAWPRGTRAPRASYRAHELLRAHDDRKAILNKLIEKHGGAVTVDQVQEWKRSQQPSSFEPWLDMVKRRFMATVKLAETPEAREAVADMLDQIVLELRRD